MSVVTVANVPGITDTVLKMSHELRESLQEGRKQKDLLSFSNPADKDEQTFPQSTSEISVTSKYL